MPEDQQVEPRETSSREDPTSRNSGSAARITALESENRDLTERLASITGSASWRLTEPIRGLLSRLRGVRRVTGRHHDETANQAAQTIAVPRADFTPSTPKAGWVLATGLLDVQGYRERAGLGDVGDLEAADHYSIVGEARGIWPNDDFDPRVYAELYREVEPTNIGLLIHYAHHGLAERRITRFDGDQHLRRGGQAFDPSRSTMLLVCHEASRTGAPILGWNLARQFNRTHNLVIAMVHPDGTLIERFVDEACWLVGPFTTAFLDWRYQTRFGHFLQDRFGFDVAVANSIECHPLLVGLAAAAVPSVTLVHEFPASVDPPSRITSGLMLSTEVVFDVRAQQSAALDLWPGITTRNQRVFHQGASEIPPDPVEAGRSVRAKVRVRDAVRGRGDRPVVLGLGTVSMRKGTDLFVSCAAAVRKRLGAGAVRFVWVGHSPKPHPERQFMEWLDDQVKRTDLGHDLVFLDAVDDLAEAYGSADVVMISSRLDPFPNVAMDAALAGVPVICFADGNGFADYLADDARTRNLSVPFLDVDAAASEIVAILRDPSRCDAYRAALRERSARDFGMELYIERLAPVIADAKAITVQERRDVALLIDDPTFAPELWLNPHELFTREEAIRLHVRKAASGQEANQYCRRPALGFVPQTYADHHPHLDAIPYPNPLAHWVRTGKPAGPWCRPVLIGAARAEPGRGGDLRAALHIHLHYPELAEGMLACLAVNAARPDLFVSTDSPDKAERLKTAFAAYPGEVAVETCPNRGRDVGPLLTLFADVLQGYDVIGHVHGKRSLALTEVGLSLDLGVRWQAFLLQHLVGDALPMADLILDRFAAEERLGLVFPDDPNLTGWSKDREIARALARRMDPDMTTPQSIDFPIGTMFWARPAALKPLFDLRLGWDDYPEEPVPIDGTMLHALERLLPVIATHAGFTLTTTHVAGVTR